VADQSQKQNQQDRPEQSRGGNPDGPEQAEDRGIPRQPSDIDKGAREGQARRQDQSNADRARDNDYGIGEEQNPSQPDGER
jgi:hypothetical protein